MPDPEPFEPAPQKANGAKAVAAADQPVKLPARSTLHDEIVTLNLALKAAVRHGWLFAAPDVSAPYNAQPKITHRPWFTPVEYKLIYETSRENARNPEQPQYKWHAEQLHDFVLLMGNTEMRPHEASLAAPGCHRRCRSWHG